MTRQTRGKGGVPHTAMGLVQNRPSLILKFKEMATQEHVAIPLNFKMRHGPLWTNSMVGVVHPLLSIWTPSVLSTRLVKSVYFLLVETVELKLIDLN